MAQKIYFKVVSQIADGKWFEKPEGEEKPELKEKALRDLLEKYFEEHAIPNLAPKTVAWKRIIAQEALELFGDLPLIEITPKRIAFFKFECRKKCLSPATVNHKLGLLNHTFFELLKTKARERTGKNGYVFSSETDTKINARNLLRAFYNALKRAEIANFRLHDLRHTFATRLAYSGVDIYKIAKLLGHKDIRMTQRYSHHYSESLRDGVEVLDRLSTIK